MHRYEAIPRRLKEQLDRVAPSHDTLSDTLYYPCAVTLDDGRELARVYVMEYGPYIRSWGIAPEDDPGKSCVSIERVVAIRESPFRLPPRLATAVYDAGESGMGHCIFTVEFADGTRQAYGTGNAVDFILPPPGLTAADARKVFPHEGRDAFPDWDADYVWCLYQGTADGEGDGD